MASNKEIRSLSTEEKRQIAERLEGYDAVFSQIWQIGQIWFNEKIKTACVAFDEIGQCISLEFNPVFWQKQSEVQKDFIVCHEMLHVILEHGRRALDSHALNRDANNVAMDVVVNELLVSGFAFDKAEVDPKKYLCWVDTIFKDRKDVLPGQTYEYYLNALPKSKIDVADGSGGGKGSGQSTKGKFGGDVLDDHSKLTGADISKMAEQIAGKLSAEERQQFEQKLGNEGQESTQQQPGIETGGFVKIMGRAFVPKKHKWETLIKSTLKKIAGEGLEETWVTARNRRLAGEGLEETWVTARNRRLAGLAGSKLILPTEVDGEGKDKRRAKIYFLLDTSGSCAGLADRFWRLALSVPREVFDMRLFCFDTKTYPVNFKDKKLYGFGGTSFSILEQLIQKEMLKDNTRYPDGVFILSDGYGTKVTPRQPKKWYVLLTTNYKACFHPDCNFYDLKAFE